MLADFKAVANEQTQVKKDILKVLVASIVPLTVCLSCLIYKGMQNILSSRARGPQTHLHCKRPTKPSVQSFEFKTHTPQSLHHTPGNT
jgi:hypothetical protein